jgi:hypothetical protein
MWLAIDRCSIRNKRKSWSKVINSNGNVNLLIDGHDSEGWTTLVIKGCSTARDSNRQGVTCLLIRAIYFQANSVNSSEIISNRVVVHSSMLKALRPKAFYATSNSL